MTASRWRRASATSDASIAAEVALGDRRASAARRSRSTCRRRPARWRRTRPTREPVAEVALEHADEPERRVAAAPRLLPHRLEVDRLARAGGDLRRGLRRDQPELALRLGERAVDREPDPRAALVAEQLARLRGLPQVPEDHRHSSRSASRTSSSAAPHGTTSDAPSRRTPRSYRQHFISVGPSSRGQHARAEVHARGRLGAVQRHVDLARALAAHQRPVAELVRPGVEELALEAGAAAREHGRARGSQLAQVDRREVELDGRQVLVEVEHRLRHLQQLRRLRRDDLDHAHPQRRRLDDEVHVLEPALHDGHARARARGARHLGRVARVDRRIGDERNLVRPRQHPQAGHRGDDVVAHRMLDLHHGVLAAAPRDHELGAAIDPPPDQPLAQRAFVETGRLLDGDAPVRPRDEVGPDVTSSPTESRRARAPLPGTARAAGGRRRRRSARSRRSRAARRW